MFYAKKMWFATSRNKFLTADRVQDDKIFFPKLEFNIKILHILFYLSLVLEYVCRERHYLRVD